MIHAGKLGMSVPHAGVWPLSVEGCSIILPSRTSSFGDVSPLARIDGMRIPNSSYGQQDRHKLSCRREMNPGDWQGKSCLVVGASAGLGASVAQALVKRKARVILVARNAERLQELVIRLRESGGDVTGFSADVTNQEDIVRLRREIDERFDKLDLVCNCVGQSTRGAVLDTTPDEFQRLLDANFLSAVRLSRAFTDLLIESGGHLVHVGSLASKVAPRYVGAYAPSKFALAAYCQQLRMELESQGLHVMLVCPGPIRREDDAPRYAEQAEGLPEEAKKPGAGARLRGLEPNWLAEKILASCKKRKKELIAPSYVRALIILSQLSPRLGDWLLGKFTSGS